MTSDEVKLELSVVIPVFRARHSIVPLLQRVQDALESACSGYEIILVEDRGEDGSWEIIRDIAKANPRIRAFRLTRNFGQHAATLCGFAMSRGRFVGTIDDDLEQPPEALADMLKEARSGRHLVYGVFPHKTHAWWRNLTSDVVRWTLARCIPGLNREYTSLRIVRGDIARKAATFDSPFPFVDGYLSWLTNDYSTLRVTHYPRGKGRSNYSVGKLVAHLTNIIASFSNVPLRVATYLGFVVSLTGMAWLAYVLVVALLGRVTVSGWASLMGGLVTFSGVQLVIMGVIGEYVARINFKVSQRPLFLLDERTDEH